MYNNNNSEIEELVEIITLQQKLHTVFVWAVNLQTPRTFCTFSLYTQIIQYSYQMVASVIIIRFWFPIEGFTLWDQNLYLNGFLFYIQEV